MMMGQSAEHVYRDNYFNTTSHYLYYEVFALTLLNH